MQLQDLITKPSTRAFIDEARKTPGYSKFDLLHGYVYARWAYLYIAIGTGEHPLSRWYARIAGLFNRLVTHPGSDEDPAEQIGFADTYHGKVVPLQEAQNLVSIHDELHVHDLEKVIPYKRARSIIMKNPERIVALECPCRAAPRASIPASRWTSA